MNVYVVLEKVNSFDDHEVLVRGVYYSGTQANKARDRFYDNQSSSRPSGFFVQKTNLVTKKS